MGSFLFSVFSLLVVTGGILSSDLAALEDWMMSLVSPAPPGLLVTEPFRGYFLYRVLILKLIRTEKGKHQLIQPTTIFTS